MKLTVDVVKVVKTGRKVMAIITHELATGQAILTFPEEVWYLLENSASKQVTPSADVEKLRKRGIEEGGVQCPVYPNVMVRKGGYCKRWSICAHRGNPLVCIAIGPPPHKPGPYHPKKGRRR